MASGRSVSHSAATTLDCFTRCCRDVSIVLTPYDVLRLKRALGIDSSEFLEKYTISPFTHGAEVPDRAAEDGRRGQACPFVGEQGCGVYREPARGPAACIRWAWPSPETRPRTTARFTSWCGKTSATATSRAPDWTVREWIADQGIEEYDMMGASFKELMLHPFWDRDEALTPPQMDMFYMACYDLDRFRRFVFETRFPELFEVDEARVEAMRKDDEELLDFAMQWLRFSLFGEQTMKIERRPRPRGAGRPSTGTGSGDMMTAADGKPILVLGGGIAGHDRGHRGGRGRLRRRPRREGPVPRRPRGPDAPVLSQALPARLRPGDQLQADQEQPPDQGPDAGRAGGASAGRRATTRPPSGSRRGMSPTPAPCAATAPRPARPSGRTTSTTGCPRPRPPICLTPWPSRPLTSSTARAARKAARPAPTRASTAPST